MACEIQLELMRKSQEAALQFSSAVEALLKSNVGIPDQKQRALAAKVRECRVIAEEALAALKKHREEHGCTD